MQLKDVLTVAQLAELNPAFSESTIRWWIFNAEKNGFARCLLRVGGRVYIDAVAFKRWLEEHREDAFASGDGPMPVEP